MWPFSKIFGSKSTGPTTTELASGGWETLFGLMNVDTNDAFDDLNTRQLEALYSKNALIHRCVWEISTTAGEPPVEVGRYEGDGSEGGFKPRPNHWATRLLTHPNSMYDWRTFMQYYAMRLMLTGATPIWKWGAKRSQMSEVTGPIAEMWPLPTHMIKIIASGKGSPIKGFKVKQKDDWIDLEPEDMIYPYYPDPGSTYKAIGPLQAASHDAQLDQRRENYVGEMMQNLVVPGLGIFAPEGMNPQKKEELRESIQDRAGPGHRGGTMFLEGPGLDAKLFNPMKDVDLPGLITMTEARICSVFGVPAEMVGARTGLKYSTYSNKAEARRGFYRDTMKPFWRGAESALTRGILRASGETEMAIRFNLTAVEELQEARSKKSERAREDYKAGIITREEAREAAGYPADAPEGTYLTPAGMMESVE